MRNGNVGDLRAPGPHSGESLVAGRVEECDAGAFVFDLVGAHVLGNPARLAFDDVGVSDGVEERSLSVVHVSQDRYDRGARFQRILVFLFIGREYQGSGARLRARFGFERQQAISKDGRDDRSDAVFDNIVDGEHIAGAHKRLYNFNRPHLHGVG